MLPCPALAPFIHHYWLVRWELRAPFTADTLPHPAGRIELFEHDDHWQMQLVGVRTGRFAKQLTGTGQFFGVQFRPATCQALLPPQLPMGAITDRTLPITRVFGPDAERWAHAIRAASSLEAKVALVEDCLSKRLTTIAAEVARIRDLVEHVAIERGVCGVEQLTRHAGLDHRALQRRFRRFVGVHPKWVIRRYRLLEAVAQLGSANPPKLAALATELGYADQAHFQRDFKLVTGRTPGTFPRYEPVTTS